MKKVFFTLAIAALSAQTMSAQTVEESKLTDNWYIGVNGGLNTKTSHNALFKNVNPSAGLRIGRNFTPVFGLAAEGEVDEVLDVGQAQPAGHSLKLDILSLAEAVQTLGQVIQLVNIDVLRRQPVEDGVLAVQTIHPTVAGIGGADDHLCQ